MLFSFCISLIHRKFVAKRIVMLKEGLTYTSVRVVEEHHLAVNMGSGDLRVLATPSMVALMEEAAMLAVAPHLLSPQHIPPLPLMHVEEVQLPHDDESLRP